MGLSAPAAAGPAPQGQYLRQGLQWGLSAIGAPSAWQYGTGAGVKIGIVDTGIDFAQQDLQGKVAPGDSTVIESSPSAGCATPATAQDDNGHGTHVAGIAAASGAYGVDGAAPGASFVVAKVLDCQGSGTYQDVEAGIKWVVDHGARVVNLSLGDAGTGLVDQSQLTGQPLAGMLQYAWDHGAVPVVAAGNNSNGVLGLGEANFTNVPAVVVAATGPDGGMASYSNSVDNAQWGIAAPGGDDPNGPTTPTCGTNDTAEVLSTYWMASPPGPYNAANCYASDEGTSMATPFVSGTVALLLGRGLSPSQAVQTLLSTANHALRCGSDCSGFLRTDAAVLATVGNSSSGGTQQPPSGGGAGSVSGGPSTTAARASTGTAGGVTQPGPSSATPRPAAASAGSPRARRGSSAGRPGRAAVPPAAHHGIGSAWMVALLALLGAGLLGGTGAFGRRLLLLRRSGGHAGGPWPDPPGTGGAGIPAPI